MDFQSRNLTVPRGKVLFARYLTGTQTPGPFKELGNTPEFTLSREVSKLSHYSSQAGMKVLDEELTTDSKLTGTLMTDDMRATNVALWMMGTVTTLSQSSLTAQVTNISVDAGDVIQLGRTSGNPAGARKVTVASVTSDPTGTTYVANTDYIVHSDLGLVEIVAGGAIGDGDDIIINWSAAAATSQQISVSDTDAEGEMKFISYNAQGAQADITLPRVKISPNGDMSMLSDPENPAWQTITLSISALQKDSLALAYRNGRPV
jgi:hypothetical protein